MASKKILSEADIDYLEKRLSETFPTKEDFQTFKSDFFEKIDPILKEVVASREERIIQDKNISNHEDRIQKIEINLASN